MYLVNVVIAIIYCIPLLLPMPAFDTIWRTLLFPVEACARKNSLKEAKDNRFSVKRTLPFK
jgi:hypothetical protein